MALPFQFEPEYHEDEIKDYGSDSSVGDYEETEVSADRLSTEVSSCCCCGECQTMETTEMCLCCSELETLSHLTQDTQCVVLHESFSAVCLNRDVLWTDLVSLHDRESTHLPRPDNIPNESLRYAAYRQFIWWTHGYLGKSIRRIIPACAVTAIRGEFPDPNSVYTGFKNNDEENTAN